MISGSPPHTRGKLADKDCRRVHHRITPAYAGKTDQGNTLIAYIQDHPHIRGENSPNQSRSLYNAGSPPHTRGKLYSIIPTSASLRITPAYAGKTPILLLFTLPA